MKKHKCPRCGEEELEVFYDDPSLDGCDSFNCKACGWSG